MKDEILHIFATAMPMWLGKDFVCSFCGLNYGVAHSGMHGDLRQFQIYLLATMIISHKIQLTFNQPE